MKLLTTAAVSLAVLASSVSYAAEPTLSSPATSEPTQAGTSQVVIRAGSKPSSKGAAETFTGNVQINPLFPAGAPASFSGGAVTFEPGARSAWHTHPAGQLLIVTNGTGWTQQWGGAVVELHPGDVVWCPPGVKHWHGATPTSAMTHVALTGTVNGKNVAWLEKVTDEQYRK
ncbi:cupin domain-containing protein [Oxalobacteraceae bacterium OM1]|nr:cupin domain-containing protein [Oxalobacteraceae bacterium OM1]